MHSDFDGEPDNSLVLLLCSALLMIMLNGCEAQRKDSELFSTNMDMSSYAQARQHSSGNQESTFSFPVLEIYNKSGTLVYRSGESASNAQVLKDFPNNFQGFEAQEHAARLAEIVEAIPDFEVRKRKILDQRQLVILSVTLDGCKGCSIQEEALDDFKQRILQQLAIAILEIHVSHP